jgi:hypothetical protein
MIAVASQRTCSTDYERVALTGKFVVLNHTLVYHVIDNFCTVVDRHVVSKPVNKASGFNGCFGEPTCMLD